MRTTKCNKFVNRKEDLLERLTKNILALIFANGQRNEVDKLSLLFDGCTQRKIRFWVGEDIIIIKYFESALLPGKTLSNAPPSQSCSVNGNLIIT